MKPLKSITAVILLGAMLAPVVMQFIGFAKLAGMYGSFEKRLRHEIMHTITVKANEVEWVKKDREIRYGHRMFDIKETTCNNGNYTFKGYFDEEEKSLRAEMAKAAKRENDAAAQQLSQTFTTGLYVQPLNGYSIAGAASSPCPHAKTGYLTSIYNSVITALPGQPPWI